MTAARVVKTVNMTRTYIGPPPGRGRGADGRTLVPHIATPYAAALCLSQPSPHGVDLPLSLRRLHHDEAAAEPGDGRGRRGRRGERGDEEAGAAVGRIGAYVRPAAPALLAEQRDQR